MPTDDEIRALLREIRGRSDAGVGHGVESLEVFLLFPDEFRRRYAELCSRALKGALESTGGAPEAGEVGKVGVSGKWKGKRVGAGAGGGGKRYKRFWTVRDENALRVKGKVDRRLRALARLIEEGLREGEEILAVGAGVTTKGRCSCCGRFVEAGWLYCPTCGNEVGVTVRVDRRGVESTDEG